MFMQVGVQTDAEVSSVPVAFSTCVGANRSSGVATIDVVEYD
jgi:hypothetical protein